MCNTIRSSNGARQRVAGGVGWGVQSCITTATVLQCRQQQRAHSLFFFFVCVRACESRPNQTEMFSSPGEKPCASSSSTTIAAIDGTEQSEEISLGLFWESIRSRILVFVVLFLFSLPADGCLRNRSRRVGRWNWFTAPVHTPFTVHPPPPPPPPTQGMKIQPCKRTFRPPRPRT